MKFIYRFFPLLLITNIFGQIDYSIIQSDEQKLILDFNVNLISEDNLKPISIVIGLFVLVYFNMIEFLYFYICFIRFIYL